MKKYYFIILFLLLRINTSSAQENKKTYIDIKENIPKQHLILWEPGYSDEEEKQIKELCNYKSITMERTGCYGFCPIYSIEFSVNGKAKYTGIDHVEKKGSFSGELFLLHYGKLCYLVDKYLEKYNDVDFQGLWTDDATCIINIELKDGRKLEIYDYGSQGPIELWALQNAIDGLKEKVEWQLTK